jgi:hypothetical protein
LRLTDQGRVVVSRRHFIALAPSASPAIVSSPAAIARSTDPSCWSRSNPVMNSIQVGDAIAIKAKMVAIAAKAILLN